MNLQKQKQKKPHPLDSKTKDPWLVLMSITELAARFLETPDIVSEDSHPPLQDGPGIGSVLEAAAGHRVGI